LICGKNSTWFASYFESRGVDESKTFKRVHELHNLRNVIVHFPFEEEDKTGSLADYINKYGETVFPKLGTSAKDYSAEFDSYDAAASELYEKLRELLDSATPITQISDDLSPA
jgi:hypothetical protein